MVDMALNAKDQKLIDSQLSANFILHESETLRGYSKGLEYDSQRATFRPKTSSHDAIQLTKGALELYYNSDPKHITFSSDLTWDDVAVTSKEARARESTRKDTTWSTIVDTVKTVRAGYDSKGRFRKVGRSLGDIAPAIVHKLDFAPDQMYVNVICQGLKFVFDAAIKLADKRKKILDTFENIPALVKDVHAYDQFFDKNKDYVQLREDFDVCLLTAIANSIQWLAKPPIWKLIEVLIQGPLAVRKVEDLMDDVQAKRNKLHSRIEILKTELQQRISKDAETGVHQNNALLSGQVQIKDDIVNVTHKIEEIGAKYDAIYLQQQRTRNKDLEDALNSQVVICNAQLAILCDNVRHSSQVLMPPEQQQHQRRRQKQKTKKAEVAEPIIHQGQLTSFMAVDDDHLADISHILENSTRFDMDEMRLAYAVANSTDIRDWLSATRGILFLNGSGDMTAARESPISAALASLVFGIAQNPDAVVLRFFCGLHCEPSQAISGPSGLLRSLIAQLSFKYDFDLGFINNESYREGLREHDLQTLCETFSAMVSQLPTDSELYCVIDGISWLETPRWREDLVAAVAYICYLCVNPVGQTHLKVLISSPARSLLLTQELREYGEHVNVVEVHSIRVTKRDMPTKRELMERTRRR